MGKRRIIISAVVLLLLAGIVSILWTALEWPPPRLILKHGLPTGARLTGRSFVDPSGIEFVEIAAGETWCRYIEERPGLSAFDDLRFRVGLKDFEPMATNRRSRLAWVRSSKNIWISRERIPLSLKEAVSAAESDVHLCSLTGIGTLSYLLRDWTLSEQVAPFLRVLPRRQGGTYSIPSRDELLFAHAVGGIADTRSSEEVVLSEANHAFVNFEDGVLLDTGPAWVEGPTVIPIEFHLVWIPPEDEE